LVTARQPVPKCGYCGAKCSKSSSAALEAAVARRVLMTTADPIERVPPNGAWLWRLRNTADQFYAKLRSSA
jgi:hypothetical protein